MSWLSKAAKKVGGFVKSVAKPIEKIVGPIVKNTLDSIPGIGPIITGTHDAIKRNIWDPLRRGDSSVITELKEGMAAGIGGVYTAAVTGARAGVTAQQAGVRANNILTNNPGLVLGAVGVAVLAMGLNKRR